MRIGNEYITFQAKTKKIRKRTIAKTHEKFMMQH